MDFFYALGNDAAIALAEHVAGSVPDFANLMNEKVEELNLKDTHFVTPHGLDEEQHYTTAYELALITDYALNIEEIEQIVKTKSYTVNINGNSKNINNTNELLRIFRRSIWSKNRLYKWSKSLLSNFCKKRGYEFNMCCTWS